MLLDSAGDSMSYTHNFGLDTKFQYYNSQVCLKQRGM